MFGGVNANRRFLVPMDNCRLTYNSNAVPPMQFDVLSGSNGGTINMVTNNNASTVNLPMTLSSVSPIFSQHKLPVTSHDGIGRDEGEQAKNIWKQIPVCTGLKLSYGEEDLNSSMSSAGESAMVNLSSGRALHDNLQTELVRQSNVLDQYIRIQEENFRNGMAELTHRHTMSLLNALEKEVSYKMRQKDAEIENLNRKNKELVDKVGQVSIEAQSWHHKAKQNETLVNTLRANINQVFLQQAAFVKECCDENVVDAATSSCNPNYLGPTMNVEIPTSLTTREPVMCKGCRSKEVGVVLLPCRHLCLCTDCEVLIEICPVCRVMKAGCLQVYMS